MLNMPTCFSFFFFWFFFPLFERAKFGVEMSDSIHSGCSFFLFVASHTLRASLSVAMGCGDLYKGNIFVSCLILQVLFHSQLRCLHDVLFNLPFIYWRLY